MKNFISRFLNYTRLGNFIKTVIISIKDRDYYNKSSKNRGKVYISYLTEPFRNMSNPFYLNKHQNRRETLSIDKIFGELGFSRRFSRFDKIGIISHNYDIIFGLEPNFVTASKKNPQAIKIYYATGAYYEHQNKMILQRTASFNAKHNTKAKPSRLVIPHNSPEIADYIIQIGSLATVCTYPNKLHDKIHIIRQSCHDFKFHNFLDRKLNCFNPTEFIWMGSGGSILKGLDLILDYFLQYNELKLHIVGPIDPDVLSYYEPLIARASNIINHGFLDLDSQELEYVALTSSFVIMPSGSEGCPGAVINMAKLGCVPIVSKYACYDGNEDKSIFIEDLTDDGFALSMSKALSMNYDQLTSLIKANYMFANSNFNLSIFESDFENALETIMRKHSERQCSN